MSWASYINNRKEFLLKYFNNGCPKCMYNELSNEYDDEFEIVDLCDDCLNDKPRILDDVIFNILRKIFEKYELEDFNEAMIVFDVDNNLMHAKERLLKYYIEMYKKEKKEIYEVYIQKILCLGIDPDYPFSKFRIIPYIFLKGIRTDINVRLFNILKNFGFEIFDKKDMSSIGDNKIVNLTNLARFIILA